LRTLLLQCVFHLLAPLTLYQLQIEACPVFQPRFTQFEEDEVLVRPDACLPPIALERTRAARDARRGLERKTRGRGRNPSNRQETSGRNTSGQETSEQSTDSKQRLRECSYDDDYFYEDIHSQTAGKGSMAVWMCYWHIPIVRVISHSTFTLLALWINVLLVYQMGAFKQSKRTRPAANTRAFSCKRVLAC
jgi:hypothetical protein